MNTGKSDRRLFSLDLLRGLDMIFLVVVAPLLWAINEVWPLADALKSQLVHPWEGFTCWDLIMPMFIFICGAAIPLSLEKRLARNGGRPDAGYWKHIVWRFVMLWALGLLVQGRLTTLDWMYIRLYDNTLQAIACGYLVVALTILIPNVRLRAAVPAACFVLYGVMLHFLGDYSPNGNFAAIVEQNLLLKIVPVGSETWREISEVGILADQAKIPGYIFRMGSEVHYTWYLTSLMCAFMAFAGYYATKILQTDDDQWKKARRIFLYGAVLLTLGWILTLCGVKTVKHIYTVSFTAQAMGWSALLLAALYVLTDIWKFRRGLGVCVLFGQFALTVYLMEEFFRPVTVKFAEMLTGGFPHLLGTAKYQPLVVELVVIAEIIVVLSIRRKVRSASA